MSVDDVRLSFQDGGMWVLNAIIGFIMFGVALDLRIRDFARVTQSPKAPLVGLFAQFAILPGLTYLLTLILQPSPSVALGMILIASCPGGNLSNFLTHYSKGNTALSVTMTACSTVAAILLTPLNLAFWGGLNPRTATILAQISLDPFDLVVTIAIILGVPILLGMTFARFLPTLARQMHRPFQIFSIVAFVSFVMVAFVQNFHVFLNFVGLVAIAVATQNGIALALGYFGGWAVGLPERDRRAISIEVGIQNSALGLALVFRYFDGLGGMALVAGWWGIWHAISGLTLGSYWTLRPAAKPGEHETA